MFMDPSFPNLKFMLFLGPPCPMIWPVNLHPHLCLLVLFLPQDCGILLQPPPSFLLFPHCFFTLCLQIRFF